MTSARYSYTTVSSSDRSNVPNLASSQTNPLKRSHPSSTDTPSSSITRDDDEIFTSPPIHDRKSTFTGYFSPTIPPQDLQSHPSIASASHKILAYRIPVSAPVSSSKKSRQSTLSSAGFGASKEEKVQLGKDDDGEQYAAKHVVKVLEEGKVLGSLVVARWYGGVMLGPVRFQHIENAARGAIQAWRERDLMPRDEKGAREVDGEEDRKTLANELAERDESILSLRKLLDSKKRMLGSLEGKGEKAESPTASPVKKMDYDTMPLQRLRLLDNARDKTIAFLLKQINEVEQSIKDWENMFDAE